jgi:hypothetical protein
MSWTIHLLSASMANVKILFSASLVADSENSNTDFIRTFTWDKKLESWVKERGFVGGGTKEPTIVTPRQYKNRCAIVVDANLVFARVWSVTFCRCRIALVFMIFGVYEIPLWESLAL